MLTLHRYQVFPSLPEPLRPLVDLGKNLWWSWHREARELFHRIDPALYEQVAQNPIALLASAPQERLEELARDDAYLSSLDRIRRALADYLLNETWFDRKLRGEGGGALDGARIGYFSMEFGIHECLPVYSGGLGVLAGDHLKSASDLGLPLVGVGIAFSQGYFHQRLDEDGWQGERYPPNDWHDLPVSPVTGANDHRVVVKVTLPAPHPGGKTRDVLLQAYRVDVGRVPLFLLDANLDLNAPEDRALTNTLYGGDRTHRIRQEILLGVGGLRLLHALGLAPTLCHMNEGHSAFLALERVRELMQERRVPLAVAREVAAAGHIFTTHTPVPAGNDGFSAELIAPYLELLGAGMGQSGAETLKIGRVQPEAGGEFSMPVLAIRLADRYNGVSVLHGREARRMWKVLWPGLPEHEVPIGSITNGVHLGTWIAGELADLYTTYLGPGFREGDPEAWARVAAIPDADLWHVHERCRARLVTEVRHHLKQATLRKGRAADAGRIDGLLDPRALTIGFARRFATYKRGTLLLRDLPRLERLLHQAGRPVQLLFAGKAHPQDQGGKELIRDISRVSRSDAFRGRIVFVEDYDMEVARALVSGVDVWLNTPRRPLEASGTSGMKAALNGALNASILDGWWAEAYAGDNGFAIGHGEEHADAAYGDQIEAQALYRLLEEDVIPQFFDRDARGIPHRWVARMKRSIQTIAPVFNTHRMVMEYAETLYLPAAERVRRMTEGELSGANAAASWRARVEAAWPLVRVEAVGEPAMTRLTAGSTLAVTADVHLGRLGPADVSVELYHGKLHGEHALPDGETSAMRCVSELGGNRYRFEGAIPAKGSGEHAFAVRVVAHRDGLPSRFAMHLLTWH